MMDIIGAVLYEVNVLGWIRKLHCESLCIVHSGMEHRARFDYIRTLDISPFSCGNSS